MLATLCLSFRQRFLSKPLLKIYRQLMPQISRTEKEALEAGTVGWEGEIFSGRPAYKKLLAGPKPELSSEEKAFLLGPVEKACAMINDWEISRQGDLPKELWDFLKKEGFFALLIPKEYGGKGFSNYACSEIQLKIQSASATVGTTVSVPNSLGPAELLLHYGTEEQKSYYLPRLASGEEVPCFALTSPDAGSDATAMLDSGIICEDKFAGKSVLGIRLNWNKRYITLAPIATVIGLAFKLYDPEHLLGQEEDLGITCALIPRSIAGISIGRRHLPLSTPFQNGPIQGKDVFIPLGFIIGGPEKAGQGWRMLMECLAGGRGLSLPALATGLAKAAVFSTGAYARIRRQFKQPLYRFEGVAEVIGRMASNLYLMESLRLFILGALDQGEKPAVASALIKYQVTEKARAIGNDAMDIQGGKGIILGPKNLIGRSYESIPIAITVEGANILTRNMIIFGQGAMRCHPYILAEYQAAKNPDEKAALSAFDQAIFAHLGFIISNGFRTFILGLTGARLVRAPRGEVKQYFQQLLRFSSAFALFSDLAILVYGKNLKRKESVSARLGDLLSSLYLVSAVLKRFHQEGCPVADLALVHSTCQSSFYELQERFSELLNNFPSRILACLLKGLIFPWGFRFKKPSTKLAVTLAELFSSPTDTRKRLTAGLYLTPGPTNNLAEIEAALAKMVEAEALQVKFKNLSPEAALEKGLILRAEYELLLEAETLRQKIIAVDDFEASEFRNCL